jgi:hypothetical protein
MPFRMFDVDAVRLLNTVTDAAMKELAAANGHSVSSRFCGKVKVEITRNIVDAIRLGERDRAKLKQLALKGLARA